MKQTSKRLASIGLAILFVIVALILIFQVVEPEYGNFETLKGQLAGEQAFLKNETQAVAQAQTLIGQYQSESQSAQTAALALPTGEDLAGALAQIYGLAANADVTIQGLSISAPSLQGETTPSTNLVQPLGTLTFQLSASGSYEALQNFLTGLQTNVRIFDMKEISISAAGLTGGKSVAANPDVFTYDMTVATYYQLENNTSSTP